MKRPRRWIDEQGVSADVRELLANARPSRALPEPMRTRSIARLDRYLVWPAAAGILLWLKGVAIAAGVGIAGVVAVAEVRPMLWPSPMTVPVSMDVAANKPRVGAPMMSAPRVTTAATPDVAVAPASAPEGIPPPPAASEAIAAPAAPSPAMASPLAASTAGPDRTSSNKPSAPASKASAPPVQPETDPLTLEAAMLERARASLDRDPQESLSELDACAARFPSGTLRIERELLAVDALTRVGSRGEARRRAEALLSAARGSIYEPRVRSMLDKLQMP